MQSSRHQLAIKALVIGASAGGMQVLSTILPQFPRDLPIPVFLVQHQKATGKHYLCSILRDLCPLHVVESEDKMPIQAAHLYIAPADYHMLIESEHHISLSLDDPVHCCRPSVDTLFESAADVFQSQLAGIVLTGLGQDGADGLLEIHQAGGICAVQAPSSCHYPSMPEAALANVPDAQAVSPELFDVWLMHSLATKA